jgi:ABC-type lipoprotein release transport system permease subunit
MRRHLRILDFAIANLRRRPAKFLVVVLVYSILVAALASLMMFVDAVRREARSLLDGSPEIIVQSLRGGRHELIPVERAETIRAIRGVGSVTPRVWGYSYDPPTGATLTFWGAESVPDESLAFEDQELSSGELVGGCVIGSGLADLRFLGVGDRLPVKGYDGSLFAPKVVGIFESSSSILTNDLVVWPTDDLRRVFAIDPALATDLAVEIHNRNEIDTVAAKILERWPDARVITRDQIFATYDAAFDWRGGLWAAFMACCVAAFAILVWDKGTGLSAEEYRTIGLLRATGWKSREVMELRVFEGGLVSLVAFLTGLIIAQIHLICFDGFVFARVIKGWSVLFPSFEIVPVLDLPTLLICGSLSLVPYIAANLVPSWKASVTDPDSVLRS